MTVGRQAFLVAALSLGGCPSVSGVTAAPAKPQPEPQAELRTWIEPDRVRLALLSHDRHDAQGRVVSVVLEPQGPTVVGPFAVPAVPHPYQLGVYRVVAGHDGADAFAVGRAESKDGPWFVDVRDLGERATWRSVPIPHSRPAALHIVGDRVMVGHDERLSTFVISDAQPAMAELRHRPPMRGKAYDLFARAGRYLIAIDDVVTPIYADSFDLAGSTPIALEGFELPGIVNGHYAAAAFKAGPGASGRLFSIASFGTLEESGQQLLAVAFVDGAPVPSSVDAQAMVLLRETVPNMQSGPPSSLVGDAPTPWTGLAYIDDDGPGAVLIAAGSRGVLRLPADYTSRSRPSMHDLGGVVADVIAHGQRAWALRVEGERSVVVELAFDPSGAIGLGSTVLIDGAYQSFVR